jgi:hypothetical protein
MMSTLTDPTVQMVLWGAIAILFIGYLAKRRARLSRGE